MVEQGSIIHDSYIMGNDYYNSPILRPNTLPDHPGIGENCIIRKAIIDRNVRIGDGVQLINKDNLDHYNGRDVYIRDGVTVVPRGATLPDGFIL